MPVFSSPGTVRASMIVGRPCSGELSPRQMLPSWLNQHEASRVRLCSQNHNWCWKGPKFLTVNNKNMNVDNTNGAIEPTRFLLEKLFLQTQIIEEKMNSDSGLIQFNDLNTSLEVLESDIRAALLALRKREEDLQNAEMKIRLDRDEMMRAKKDLEYRERMIALAVANQEKMDNDLKIANRNLELKAIEVGNLRLLLEEQRWKIVGSQGALSAKEDELDDLRNELVRKNNQMEGLIQEIESRDNLLNEANKVITKQEMQLGKFQAELKKRENELASSLLSKRMEEEKLRDAESKLEKMHGQWLLTQNALNQLAREASKQATMDFKRVSSLLSDVKLELVSSRESIAASQKALEVQVRQLEDKREELKGETLSLTSYAKKLEGAQLEVEKERTELNDLVAQRDKLCVELLLERRRVEKLDDELRIGRRQVEEALGERDSIRRDLQQKTLDFNFLQDLLHVRESELEEAKLEIWNLHSERALIEVSVREKDQVLTDNQRKLMDLEREVLELRSTMEIKENLIVQMTRHLREKEEHIFTIESELGGVKLHLSNTAANIQQISQLTDNLVDSLSSGVSLDLRNKGMHEMKEITVDKDSECNVREESCHIHEVEKELTNLLSLTKKLLKDAGISS